MAYRTNSAPIFLDRTILRGDPGGFKLVDGACHRIVGDVDIPIHGRYYALVFRQFLQCPGKTVQASALSQFFILA